MQNQPVPPGQQSGAKVYEMQWDCRFCGTKKLLGKTHRFCPNCGGQQDPSWRYFPSDTEKVAVQDHVYVGADRICPSCKSLNSAQAEFCGNCGSPLSGAKQAQTVSERQHGEGGAFETEDLKKRQLANQVPAAAPQAKAQPKKTSRVSCLVILLVVLVLGGGAAFALTRTTNSKALVTGFRWERSISIEALSPVNSKSGCSSMPADAYAVSQKTEQVDTKQVADGETCRTIQKDNGDGTFSERQQCETKYRDEPVYGQVCYYTINRWTASGSIDTKGDKSSSPAWGDVSNMHTGNCLGCERESGRKETYYLELKSDGGKAFECAVPFDQWSGTKMEAGFTVEIGNVLKNVRCETLKPAA